MIPIAIGVPSGEGDTPGEQAYDVQHLMRPGVLHLPSLPPLSLYVHLPWCIQKCPYCDFNSHAAPQGALPEAAYVDALVRDLEVALPMVWGRSVHSIFIGGGTPSLFTPQSIDRLLGAIRARLRLVPDCEITLEANPGTFEKDRFRAFAQAGVTRLSVGVQSFKDQHLKTLGRVHDSSQACAALEEAARSFSAFNLDLMYALPGQSLAQLDEDLDQALAATLPRAEGMPCA
jgi:oxygen-independent coproporphyrinogen-3 oxidase